MRILMVSDDWDDPRVGAAKAPHKLQRAFADLGHSCDLLFSGDLGGPQHERIRFPFSPLLALRATRKAWRLRGPYDVIDVAGGEGWLIFLARRAFPGATTVARTHGLEHIYYRELVADHRAGFLHKPWFRRLWYPATRLSQVALTLRLARRAILLNSRSRSLVIERGWKREDEIDLISHGVDADRWRAAPPPDAPRGAGALFSGCWYTGKGTPYLAAAHRLLLERGLKLPLTLLGGGTDYSQAHIERHVRSSFCEASQPYLTIVPRLSDEDAVFSFYRNHDFLVCPSTAEGFGMVVIEAMSQRLPVVASDAVGACERVRDGHQALVVPTRNAPALADAMARLWHSPALRRELAENAYAWVRPFTWQRAAAETIASYEAAGATGANSGAAAAAPGAK